MKVPTTLFIIIFLFIFPLIVSADNITSTWQGIEGGGGEWDVASNWVNNPPYTGYPDNDETNTFDVIIGPPGTGFIPDVWISNISPTINSLSLMSQSGQGSSLSIESQSLTIVEDTGISIEPNSKIDIWGTSTIISPLINIQSTDDEEPIYGTINVKADSSLTLQAPTINNDGVLALQGNEEIGSSTLYLSTNTVFSGSGSLDLGSSPDSGNTVEDDSESGDVLLTNGPNHYILGNGILDVSIDNQGIIYGNINPSYIYIHKTVTNSGFMQGNLYFEGGYGEEYLLYIDNTYGVISSSLDTVDGIVEMYTTFVEGGELSGYGDFLTDFCKFKDLEITTQLRVYTEVTLAGDINLPGEGDAILIGYGGGPEEPAGGEGPEPSWSELGNTVYISGNTQLNGSGYLDMGEMGGRFENDPESMDNHLDNYVEIYGGLITIAVPFDNYNYICTDNLFVEDSGTTFITAPEYITDIGFVGAYWGGEIDITNSYDVYGTVEIDSMSSMNVSGDCTVYGGEVMVNGYLSVTGVFEMVEGYLSGTGEIVCGSASITGEYSTVSPGNSPGTLYIYSDLTFGEGAIYEWEIEDDDYDQIVVDGDLTLVGDIYLDIYDLTGDGQPGDYAIFDVSGDIIEDNVIWHIDWPDGWGGNILIDGGEVILSVSYIPEPSTIVILLGSLLGFSIKRNRK